MHTPTASRGAAPSPRRAVLTAASIALAPSIALAQDATRGESLYRALPGNPGVGSCISCHGEAVNNRNSVLRGAAGAALISKTITAVSAMGYLRQYLDDADLSDIAAYLGTVLPTGTLAAAPDPWPASDDFGAQQVGTTSGPREVLIRNLQPRSEIAVGAVLSSAPEVFAVQHDCPLSLPPLGQCRATVRFQPLTSGPASATLRIVDSGGQTLRTAAVSGTGIDVQAPALAWSTDTPPLLDFGRVAAGQTARLTATLLNPSPQAVDVRRLRVTGPAAARFSLGGTCAPAGRLEPGTACELSITFAPPSATLAEGWIEIDADASNAPLVRVAGLGAAPASPPASNDEPPAGDDAATGGGATTPLWLALLVAAVIALRRHRMR